jgi:copper chaperone
MIEIKVPDMTCSHCAGAITKAVKDLDPGAKLDFALAEHVVRVEGMTTREALLRAIGEAGYHPQA